ncbi:MAG: CPBP family intramembrane metalloprotease [Bacteroidetes bacterium]|jgi:membrane protease YdiL (CAAX protease family)|nr:CPBP family intramembrane metalloprotease [Bacteroidota bacterium]
MRNKVIISINLIIILFLLAILFFKNLIPIESNFLRQILIYTIGLLVVFAGVRIFYSDKIGDFAFTTKNKVSKKVKRNARLIGLLIGIITNIAIIFMIDADDYLKGYHIIQKIVLAILLAPIVEEIIFRGYIQTILGFAFAKYKTHKIFWLPIILTSLIFSLLHFTAIKTINIYQTISIVILALAIGLFAGYFKEKYNSLIPSINLHIFSNMGAFFALLIVLIISPSTAHKQIARINKPTYHFDMNDSTMFMNSLMDFSIYEKILPDSMRGKFQNIPVATLLTIDSTGKIVDIQLDSIRNEKYKITSEYYKSKALEVANKLPDFVPPKNLKGDTTILFYVSF